MISPWTIYWITRLDGIIACFIPLAVLSFLFIGVLMFLWFMESDRKAHITMVSDDVYKLLPKYIRWLLVGGVFGVLGLIFTPTTKQMAVIYLIPAIANNEQIQAEASELYDLAKDYLELQTREPKPIQGKSK